MAEGIHDIVRRCLAGEESAAWELVRRHADQVFGLCHRMLGHRQDAEDAAQESFLRALRGLKNWDPAREFLPWLLAIAGNRCRTRLADRSRRPRLAPLPEPIADESPNLERARNLAEEVALALQSIRAEYRQAFVLFQEQELNYEQIAQVMDRPLGTVKTFVHRARRELIDRLRERGVLEEARHAVRAV